MIIHCALPVFSWRFQCIFICLDVFHGVLVVLSLCSHCIFIICSLFSIGFSLRLHCVQDFYGCPLFHMLISLCFNNEFMDSPLKTLSDYRHSSKMQKFKTLDEIWHFLNTRGGRGRETIFCRRQSWCRLANLFLFNVGFVQNHGSQTETTNQQVQTKIFCDYAWLNVPRPVAGRKITSRMD